MPTTAVTEDRSRPNPDYRTPRRGEIVGYAYLEIDGKLRLHAAIAQGGKRSPRWERVPRRGAHRPALRKLRK